MPESLLDRILNMLPDAKPYGNGYRARCPAHNGDNSSALEITEKEDGKVLLHCYAHGCNYEDILKALGLWGDRSQSRRTNGHRKRARKPRGEPQEIVKARQRAAQEIFGILTDPIHIPSTSLEEFGCYIGVVERLQHALLEGFDVQNIWTSIRDDPTITPLVAAVDALFKAREAEQRGEADDEWKAGLSTTKEGIPKETLGNITLALQHLQPWSISCWYDEVRDILMIGDRELSETVVTEAALAIEAQAEIPIRSKSLVETALAYQCHQHPRDLLRAWLESLPAWDGQPRLVAWLPTYAHAPADAYGQDVSRLLPVSLVARALDPGCQYRFVVILEGPENSGKTKLVRALATPEWYRELSHGLEGKEAHMRIKRAWVAELAELSSMGRTEEARLKSFFTLNEDAYIPKFSNFEVLHRRRTVFVGTHNPEGDNTYLRAQTGNTRYLPIPVQDINIEGFQAIRTQLFAEALAYYRAHPDDWWQLSIDGEVAAREARDERRQRSVYEDELGAWLERTKRTVTWWEEIAHDFLLLPRPQWDRRLQMEVAKALKALGWEKDKRERMGSDGLVWPWRPGSDWRTQP